MAVSTEVVPAAGQAVEGFDQAELDALSADIRAEVKQSDIQMPRVVLAQGLSKVVDEGHAKAGEFVNSLTLENLGEEFEFIVSSYFYGIAYSVRNQKGQDDFFAAIPGDGRSTIPDNWPHPDAGKLFEDSDDYEDNFKALVNDGQREWSGGPPFSTTYNFVGYQVGHHDMPVRLSFMRTSSKSARKLLTLIATDTRPWDHVYRVKSIRTETDGNRYYVMDVSRGPLTPNEDLRPSVELALNISRARKSGEAFDLDDGAEESSASSKPRKGAGPAKPDDALDLD